MTTTMISTHHLSNTPTALINNNGSCTTASTRKGAVNGGSTFKATVLYRNLVTYIFRNVKQKRRRLILKGVGPTACFSGSDVCDTALLYLLMDNDNFKTTDLTREKARKLCQLLLENQVFEPLSGSSSSNIEKKFDDSSNKYYKFMPTLVDAFQQGFAASSHKPSSTDSGICSPIQGNVQSKENAPQPMIIDGVLCNPNAGNSSPSELDCGGNIIKELLGMTSTESTHSTTSALKDTNGKHRTATAHIRRIYNEHVLLNKRTSLDCEAALTHGILPRTISTGTGIAGVFKRKRSALNLPSGSESEDTSKESSLDVRRSMRLKKIYTHQSQEQRPAFQFRSAASSTNTDKGSQSHSTVQSSYSSHFEDASSCRTRCSDDIVIERTRQSLDDPLKEDHLGSHIRHDCTVSKSVEKLAKLTGEVIFSPTAIAEIRQEIALSQLSQLIDLPVLEGLVCVGTAGREETGYDNSVFFNVDQHRSLAMGLSTTDAWVRAAIDVFDYMPNGHRTTFDYQIGLNPDEYKLALYRSILKSYRSRADSLFPACHGQIHVAVLSMIMSGAEQKAVLTMRLAVMLLPCYLKAEMATLLEFLQVVSISSEPKLKPSYNNNDILLNDFSGVFFMGSKILSMDQKRVLLLLMMRYCDKLTRVPISVQETLERTMQNIKQGDDTPTPSTMFCNKLTTEQYEREQQECTEQAMVSLIKSVIDDTSMALKDKHRHIKQFSKHYPAIMAKYFSDLA